jgi:type IV secretory pathway VirD2 relaxase
MPRHLVDIRHRAKLLDIFSYGRPGPGRRDRLSAAEIPIIARTVHLTPEVMVKVLNRGGQSLGAVARHLKYLDRDGEVEIETDDGRYLKGKGVEKDLLDDWDLDLEEERRTADLKTRARRSSPKLVQKLLFSMPAGTPPQKVLAAVRNFAQEELALKHRYAVVLHTDEPHPHVHVVVKAMGNDGKRLNIRRDTLRGWRREFARHLREQGVAANATERAARGETRPQKTDGIYRAALRGVSSHWRERAEAAARELGGGGVRTEPGKNRLLATRRDVVRGWSEVADKLVIQDQVELALVVREFVGRMPPPLTEREQIAEKIREQSKARSDCVR